MVGGADAGAASGARGADGVVSGLAAVGDPGVGHVNVRPFLLSARQVAVLGCVARGLTGRETARELGIARATVRGHLVQVRARLGARSTCHAVALALRQGWL